MVCVHCGYETKVVNSRHQSKSNQVWRRRQCTACGAVFTTQETVQHKLAWVVSDGKRLQPFSRDKLFLSLHNSLQHRKTALSDADGLTETIISKLPGLIVDGSISRQAIARVAQVTLNRFDGAASAHYQAFHKD